MIWRDLARLAALEPIRADRLVDRYSLVIERLDELDPDLEEHVGYLREDLAEALDEARGGALG